MSDDNQPLRLPIKRGNSGGSATKIMKIVGCIFMCYLGIVCRRPYEDAAIIQKSNGILERQVKELEVENQKLRFQSRSLDSITSIKLQLRQNNYIKNGEAPLIVYTK